MYLDKKSKIYVAGHNGMVGSAIVRLLKERGFNNLVFRSSKELDLKDTSSVSQFFASEKPEIVILSAARVGGIQANIDHPAEFLFENLVIQNNVIHQSHLNGVKKFCFLGSSCIYPKECPQPIKEEYLMSGPLEPTNEGYALAKIAGLKLIEFYHKQYGFNGISVMPCNLYGTDDSFDPLHSHVLSALVKRFVDAVDDGVDSIAVWGSGIARREFMHVDDAAEAIFFLLEHYDSPKLINIGWGEDLTIKDLAMMIANETGFSGRILWDRSKPDGMMRKCLDVSKMNEIGYTPKTTIDEGIRKTVAEYRQIKSTTKQRGNR